MSDGHKDTHRLYLAAADREGATAAYRRRTVSERHQWLQATVTADGSVSVEPAPFLAQQVRDVGLGKSPDPALAQVTGRCADDVVELLEAFPAEPRRRGEPDRIAATVMFTDIVASTERVLALGDRRWVALLERHDAVVRGAFERFRGREVKTTGDGFLAAFDGSEDAVRAALQVVEQVRGLGLEVRAGVHAGECLRKGSDLRGATVHVGARLTGLAGPGEVLVSQAVADVLAGSELRLRRQRTRTLKGLPGRWPLYAVQGDGERSARQLSRNRRVRPA